MIPKAVGLGWVGLGWCGSTIMITARQHAACIRLGWLSNVPKRRRRGEERRRRSERLRYARWSITAQKTTNRSSTGRSGKSGNAARPLINTSSCQMGRLTWVTPHITLSKPDTWYFYWYLDSSPLHCCTLGTKNIWISTIRGLWRLPSQRTDRLRATTITELYSSITMYLVPGI